MPNEEPRREPSPEAEGRAPEAGPERSRPSLKGRGWDVLAGGEHNARARGGVDPFDENEGESAGQPADEPREASPPRDLSPEELEALGEAGLPRTLGGEPFPVGDYVSMEGPPDEVVGRTPQADADATALPKAPGAGGELPHTPETGEAEEGDESVREDEGPVAFAMGDATPFAGQPRVAAQSVASIARPHDPFEVDEETETAVSGPEELAPDIALERFLITQRRIDALWDEINEAYSIVINDVRGHYRTTETAIADLKRARELLLAGEEHFDNAEVLVKRVKARLRLEEKVRQWSRTRGTWIAVYLILWLMTLTAATLLTARVFDLALLFVPEWLAATFLPALYGGLGGVVGALWVLIKHMVKERDFDPIHTPWYVLNPFMGLALGTITYFLLRATTFILGTSPVQFGDPGEQFGLYFLSVVVGFNQNVLWALIDRVIKAIIPPESPPAATEVAAVAEPSQD